MSPWISAFRPRTLPLALASILTGGFLAKATGHFNGPVVALAALTTILLQILSNLANDYGDSQNGADSVHRQGPQRAVQSGAISPAEMKRAMWGFGAAALLSGVALTYHSPWQWLFVLSLPLFVFNGLQVWRRQESMKIDPLLKQMALSTLVFTLLFGLGQVL
jgi:1,4-dihydroxy-2-naphthoate octaprenyltransferase